MTFASDPPWDLGMSLHQNRQLRSVLILVAVLALATGVATRYCRVARYDSDAAKIARAQSLDGKRQHLLNDGLHWSAPAATFVLFKPALASPGISAVAPAFPWLFTDDCLYNRPPPLC